MPAVIPLIIAGVSAAGTVAAAKIQSNAAKGAAETQTTASNKALDIQNRIYQEQTARQQPYVDAGTQALNALRGRSGAQVATFSPGGQQGGWRPQAPPSMWAQPGNQPGNNPFAAIAGAGSGSPSPMVTVTGPDGTTAQMSADKAQQYRGRPGFSVM